MNILVYGGGAVGLGLASCLIKARAFVDVVAREGTVAELNRGGLVRTGIFGDFHADTSQFGAWVSLDQASGREYDFILVCVKSFDSAAAAADLAKHGTLFGEDTRIVLCQNGWGSAETFASHFDKRRIYNARVITGFRRPKPNCVEITVHADAIHVGSLFGSDPAACQPLCEAIYEGGIPCIVTAAIAKDLWAKMLYNCALNPLGAILRVPYGRLARSQYSRSVMDAIVAEVYAVMAAAGHQTHWPRAKDFLSVFYERLVPDTAAHESSTLQDLVAGKRTEIDALNGEVVRLAKQHNVPVPVNAAIYRVLKFMEQSRPGA